MATLYETRRKGRKVAADAVFLSEISEIDAPAKRHALIFDQHSDAPRGFGVKMAPSGRITFVLRYFAAGEDRLMRIGDYPTWPLKAAREEAAQQRQKVDTGVDILEQRRAARREHTVADAVARFCTTTDKLRSGKHVRSALERYFVASLGKRKLRKVRRAEIIEVLEGVAAEHPRTAGLLLGYVKRFFAWAEDREIIDANPAASLKPKRIGEGLLPRSRGRVLSDAEIKAFWSNVESCGMHRMTALALKLVLITGQRPGEVAGMRWEEIDGAAWTIPASRRGKTDTEHHVPLPETALEILEQAKAEAARLGRRRKKKPAGAVFEAVPGQALTAAAISRAVPRYAEALGNQKVDPWGCWRPHDLRRTVRTGLAASGISDAIGEEVVGHVKKGILGVYNVYAYADEKRRALEVWERRLLRIVKPSEAVDDNVLELRRVPAA